MSKKAQPIVQIQLQPLLVERSMAAAIVGVSLSTFETLVSRGKAPKPKQASPGCVRWLVADLQAWAINLPEADGLPPPTLDVVNRSAA